MDLNHVLRKCFDDVSSLKESSASFYTLVDAIPEYIVPCFKGYSEEYKKYFLDELQKLKNKYREPVSCNWYEFLHILSVNVNVNVWNSSDALENYDKSIYRKYLVDSGLVFDAPSPSKKRKRYCYSYEISEESKDKKIDIQYLACSSSEKYLIKKLLEKCDEREVLVKNFGISINRGLLRELYENHWIDDNIIDFTMKMFQERDDYECEEKTSKRSSHFYSCYFMKLLLVNGYDYSNVRKWSKKFNIFEKDKVFCPVNWNNKHWALLVIHVQKKKIMYYDSMGIKGKKYLDSALQYMYDEAKKLNISFNYDEWQLISYNKSLPQQENGYDCGIYVILFADYIANNLPLTFTQGMVSSFRKKLCVHMLKGFITSIELSREMPVTT